MIANLLNVTVHPQSSFLPISDHNIVFASVKLLGHFARIRRVRAPAKPPVDCRRLVTDPQLRQKVATAVGRQLRANPPGYSSVDHVEAAFTAAIMRTAELVIPSQERRRPRRGWSGGARMEVELQAATNAVHAARQRLKRDTRDAQLRRAVRQACNWLKKVRSSAVLCFFEPLVVELEMQLRVGDQHVFFQNIKPCSWRRRRRSNHSASVTRKEYAARQRAYPREVGAFLPLAAEREIRHARSRHSEETAAASSRECPQDRAHGGGDYPNDEGSGKYESSEAGWFSRGC